MLTNLILKIIIIVIAIIARRGIIYLFTIFIFSTKNLSIFINSLKKGIIPNTILIGFYSKALLNVKSEANFNNFERNEGIMVHNRDLIEINTTEQNRVFVDPVNTNTLEEDELALVQNQDTIPNELVEGFTSLDSITVLDLQNHDL
jgi:high-affinity K+ transport system ATPase subunit B